MKIKIITILTLFLSYSLFANIPNNKDELTETTLGDDSSFLLEEVTATNPAGNFVITKYWNDSGTITPVSLNLNVKNLDVVGNDTSATFKWGYNNGVRTLNPTTIMHGSDFTAQYITSENKQFVNSNGSESSKVNIMHGLVGEIFYDDLN